MNKRQAKKKGVLRNTRVNKPRVIKPSVLIRATKRKGARPKVTVSRRTQQQARNNKRRVRAMTNRAKELQHNRNVAATQTKPVAHQSVLEGYTEEQAEALIKINMRMEGHTREEAIADLSKYTDVAVTQARDKTIAAIHNALPQFSDMNESEFRELYLASDPQLFKEMYLTPVLNDINSKLIKLGITDSYQRAQWVAQNIFGSNEAIVFDVSLDQVLA